MEREPKVACVELNCPLAGEPKNNKKCEMCRDREVFATAIESTLCLTPMSTLYRLEDDFAENSVDNFDVVDHLNIFFFGAKV